MKDVFCLGLPFSTRHFGGFAPSRRLARQADRQIWEYTRNGSADKKGDPEEPPR
jgi:hypothetical protein